MKIKGTRTIKPNTVVETRTDVRALATVAQFYQKQGIPIASLSKLVDTIVCDFCALIEERLHYPHITSVEDACNILALCSFRPTHTRGESILHRAIANESMHTALSEIEKGTESVDNVEKKRQMLLDSVD